MENDNKYYIPEIEEFCIGFEYELIPAKGYKIIDEKNVEAIWATEYEKGIYGVRDVEPFGGALASIRSGIQNKKCRVKFLDKQDIEESLETKQLKGDGVELNFQITKSDYEFLEFDYDMEYKKLTVERFYQTKLIASQDENRYGCYTLFSGYIKNKNELQKLLKQLDVL